MYKCFQSGTRTNDTFSASLMQVKFYHMGMGQDSVTNSGLIFAVVIQRDNYKYDLTPRDSLFTYHTKQWFRTVYILSKHGCHHKEESTNQCYSNMMSHQVTLWPSNLHLTMYPLHMLNSFCKSLRSFWCGLHGTDDI